MRIFSTVIAAAALLFAGSASAQSASNFAAGWRQFDGSGGGYINAATLMRCPQTLGDGYTLFRADVYAASTDVSCGYKLRDDSAYISFYFYPAQGSVEEEFTTTSRPVLDRYGPRDTQRASQRDWALPTGTIKANAVEVTPRGQQGQSFAIVDVAGRRMKARETWMGKSNVSHRLADSFFALQTAALENAQACAAMPVWRATTRAKISADPGAGVIAASIMLLASDIEVPPTSTVTTSGGGTKPCIIGRFGGDDRGANLILTRTGMESAIIALDTKPVGDFEAGLTTVLPLGAQDELSDSRYALYGRSQGSTAIFRTYQTLPTWQQLIDDMGFVVTRTLTPLSVVSAKDANGKRSINIVPDAAEDEKAKRRPGSQ
jgi:hypothetical protein